MPLLFHQDVLVGDGHSILEQGGCGVASPVLADGKVEIVYGDWVSHSTFSLLKLLDESPAAFVLAGFEIFPLSLDQLGGFQFRVGLDFLDAERSYRSTQLAYRQALASHMLSLEQLRLAVGTRSLP